MGKGTGTLLALALATGPATLKAPASNAILLDTRCESAEWNKASRTAINTDLSLWLQQDARALYVCVPLPADSHGTMDLYVLPEGAKWPTNLHASAQTGERQRTETGWPDWAFGNHRQWFSPPVPLTRADVVDGKVVRVFANVSAREVEIEKAKFGPGPWRFMIEIRALGADKKGSAQFPTDASVDRPETWAAVEITR